MTVIRRIAIILVKFDTLLIGKHNKPTVKHHVYAQLCLCVGVCCLSSIIQRRLKAYSKVYSFVYIMDKYTRSGASILRKEWKRVKCGQEMFCMSLMSSFSLTGCSLYMLTQSYILVIFF